MAKRKRKKGSIGAAVSAITDSPWFVPALLGLGAFLFVSAGKKQNNLLPPPTGGGSGTSSGGGSGSGTSSGGGSGSGTSSGSGWDGSGTNTSTIQYNTLIGLTNTDTIKRIKQELNTFISAMNMFASIMTYGVPYFNVSSIPNTLAVNGDKDANFKYALKWLFVVNYNIAYDTDYTVQAVTDSIWNPYTTVTNSGAWDSIYTPTLNWVLSTITNINENILGT